MDEKSLTVDLHDINELDGKGMPLIDLARMARSDPQLFLRIALWLDKAAAETKTPEDLAEHTDVQAVQAVGLRGLYAFGYSLAAAFGFYEDEVRELLAQWEMAISYVVARRVLEPHDAPPVDPKTLN